MNLATWLQRQELLTVLAKRKTKNRSLSTWFELKENYLGTNTIVCYICNEEVKNSDEHGSMHLKQSNLLPFI